jgi:hypothetical protein
MYLSLGACLYVIESNRKNQTSKSGWGTRIRT